MSKEQVAALSKHLRPLVNETHDAQITDRDLTVHHVQFAQMTLASIQVDIEHAEAAAKQGSRTSTTSQRATYTENQTHSGNLSKNSGDSKEAETLQNFNDLYDQIPTPQGGEPIHYI